LENLRVRIFFWPAGMTPPPQPQVQVRMLGPPCWTHTPDPDMLSLRDLVSWYPKIQEHVGPRGATFIG
jgi:hypothetical protein